MNKLSRDKPSKRIVILTQPLGTNYGGILQAFAMQNILFQIGYKAVTDNKSRVRFSLNQKARDLKNLLYRSAFLVSNFAYTRRAQGSIAVNTSLFINKYIKTTDLRDGKRVLRSRISNDYDAIVVGSDQVWRKPYSNIPKYMLEFTKGMDIKRISYAASFGKDDLSEYEDKLIKKSAMLAKKFDAISVREDSGVDICNEYWGVKAQQHVDPTLLLEKDDYLKLIHEDISVLKKSDGKIFKYVLDYDKNKHEIIDKVSSHLKLKSFDIMPPKPVTKKELRSNPDKFALPHVTQWLKSFKDADFVITDSFHGTVFSIIFNKPFIAIGNKERGLTRFSSLLRLFKLEERLVSNSKSVLSIVNSPINWKKVNEIKLREKKRGIKYLKDNLELAATTKGDIMNKKNNTIIISDELVRELAIKSDMLINSNLRIITKKTLKNIYYNRNINIDPFFWTNGALSWALHKYEDLGYQKIETAGNDKLLKKKHSVRIVDNALYFYANYDNYSERENNQVYNFLSNCQQDDYGSILYRNNNDSAFIDTLGMICPFLAKYGFENNSKKATSLAVTQFRAFFNNGFEEKSGLPYHGYSSKTHIKKGIIGWGRGVGWALIGLIETLQWLPIDSNEYIEINKYFNELIATVMKYQRSDGSFSWQLQAIDGHEDTSASAMIGYALSKYNKMNNNKIYKKELLLIIKSLLRNINSEGLAINSSAECLGFSMYPQNFNSNSWGQGFTTLCLIEYKELEKNHE